MDRALQKLWAAATFFNLKKKPSLKLPWIATNFPHCHHSTVDVGSPLGGEGSEVWNSCDKWQLTELQSQAVSMSAQSQGHCVCHSCLSVQFHISQHLLGLQATPIISYGPAHCIHCSVDPYAKEECSWRIPPFSVYWGPNGSWRTPLDISLYNAPCLSSCSHGSELKRKVNWFRSQTHYANKAHKARGRSLTPTDGRVSQDAPGKACLVSKKIGKETAEGSEMEMLCKRNLK